MVPKGSLVAQFPFRYPELGSYTDVVLHGCQHRVLDPKPGTDLIKTKPYVKLFHSGSAVGAISPVYVVKVPVDNARDDPGPGLGNLCWRAT